MTDKRIVAQFVPQAWVNDNAIQVDPEGETEFDVTDAILAMGREAALELADDDYATDALREFGPEWVQEWSGPFYVRVEQAIADYFA